MRNLRSYVSSNLSSKKDEDNGFIHSFDFLTLPATFAVEFFRQYYCLKGVANRTVFESFAQYYRMLKAEDIQTTDAFHTELLKSMTIQQLDMLAECENSFKENSDYKLIYFRKQFCEELDIPDTDLYTRAELNEILMRLYNLAKAQDLDKDMRHRLAYEILETNP